MPKYEDIKTDSIVHGIFERIDESNYRHTPGLNPSTIVERRRSALHAKWAYENPGETDTPAKLFGRCCHSLLLEPDTFKDEWAIAPNVDRRTKKGKATYDEFLASSAGKQVIAANGALGFETVLKCVEAAVAKPQLKELLASGVREVPVFTGEGGLQCKGRIDFVSTVTPEAVIIDPKFTNDVTPEGFGRSCARFGYHLKMPMYAEWFRRESGKQIGDVILVAVENKPPFDCVLYPLNPLQLEDGWAQAQELIGKIHDDIHRGVYHGCDEGRPYAELDIPFWAMQDTPDLTGAELSE